MTNNAKIYLAAAADENYLQKAKPYLESVNKNSNVSNIFFTVDFDITEEYEKKFPLITFKKITSNLIKSPNINKCIQHGAFLEGLKGIEDDSIIIFTDTDINMQRKFSDSELQLLKNCKDKEILVNLNSHSRSENKISLLDDIETCRPTTGSDEISKKYPEIPNFVTYNTGVIAAKYKTYCQLYEMYNNYWPQFDSLFESFVKQQWLLSYIIQKHFEPKNLPYFIHCNAYSPPISNDKNMEHWGYIGESSPVGFKFCIGSDIVVFNHHIRHDSQLEIKSLKKTIRKLVKITILLAVVSAFFIIRSFWT